MSYGVIVITATGDETYVDAKPEKLKIKTDDEGALSACLSWCTDDLSAETKDLLSGLWPGTETVALYKTSDPTFRVFTGLVAAVGYATEDEKGYVSVGARAAVSIPEPPAPAPAA